MAKQQPKTDAQKEAERKVKLEKLKADIESGALKDLSKVSKKDREDLIKMGVSFEETKPEDKTEGDDKKTPGTEEDHTDSEDETEDEKPEDKDETESVKPPVSTEPQEKGDTVRVFSLVNMVCHDGTKLVSGEPASLSKKEYERLKKDARGPFFKE